jgi:hypothetical protein
MAIIQFRIILYPFMDFARGGKNSSRLLKNL